MKRFLLLFFILFLAAVGFGCYKYCIKKTTSITIDEFLKDENPNKWSELYLNKDSKVSYGKKVII